MLDSMHRFYCPSCRIYIAASSAARLCVCLNDHNYQKHAGNCITWEPAAIVCSMHYEEPDDPIAKWTEYSPQEKEDIRESISKAVWESIKEHEEEFGDFWKGFRPLSSEPAELDWVLSSDRVPGGAITVYHGQPKGSASITPEDRKLLRDMKIKW